jgi:hypothetical protein
MNSRLLLTVVVLAALALLALIGLQRALEEAVRERESSQPTEESAPPAASPSPEGDGEAASRNEALNESWPVAELDAACLTYAEARRHPGLRREFERLRGAGLLMDDVEAYRHVDDATLTELSRTGDTAAMMVLGQRRLLAALGRDPAMAVDLLAGRQLSQEGGSIDLEAIDRELLDEAAGWFYRAALHGRIYALQKFGDTLQWREGLIEAPVRLGWVEQAEWTGMTRMEQAAWSPPNVYAEAIYDLSPALTTGYSGIGYNLQLKSEKTQVLRDRVVKRFLADQHDAGLPPLDIPMSDFDIEEFESSLCPGVADALERDGWQ